MGSKSLRVRSTKHVQIRSLCLPHMIFGSPRVLETLPEEILHEIISHLPLGFYVTDHFTGRPLEPQTLRILSTCSRRWRRLCLPFLLRETHVAFKRNSTFATFITEMAKPYGHLVKILEISTCPITNVSPPAWLSPEEPWRDSRDQLIETLLNSVPNVSTFRLVLQVIGLELRRTIRATSSLAFLRHIHFEGDLVDSITSSFLEALAHRLLSIGLQYTPPFRTQVPTFPLVYTAISQNLNLKRLHLENMPAVEALANVTPLAPTLTSLFLRYLKLETGDLFCLLSLCESNLSTLSILDCPLTTLTDFPSYKPHMFPNLANVTIMLTRKQDAWPMVMAFHEVHLTSLSLSFIESWILVEQFQKLIQDGAFPKVQHIQLDVEVDRSQGFSLTGRGAFWTPENAKLLIKACADRGITLVDGDLAFCFSFASLSWNTADEFEYDEGQVCYFVHAPQTPVFAFVSDSDFDEA